MKHTEGPWKAHINAPAAAIKGHIIKTDYGAECPIASLFEGGGVKGKPTQIANAKLIAAAPDMLGALQNALYWNDVKNNLSPETKNMIEAAIKKATK